MTKATYTKKGLLGLMDSEEWSIGARSHDNKQQAWGPQKQAKRPHFQASSRAGTPEVSKAVKPQRPPSVVFPPGRISLEPLHTAPPLGTKCSDP